MNEIEMFKCPLFPDKANFSDADLQKRVANVLYDVDTLVDEIKNNKVYEVGYKYHSDHNFLWIIFFAKPSMQLQLKLSNEGTINEFVISVLKQIKSLPLTLNFVALELESSLLRGEFETNNQKKDLTAFMIKNSGKERIFHVENRNQHILFPEQSSFRLDTVAREITCRIYSLSRYEVLVDCVEDALYTFKRSQRLRIALVSSGSEKNRFLEIAEYLHTGKQVKFEVFAIINIINNSVFEYQFLGETQT